MDTNRLRFSVGITYDCDDGEAMVEHLEDCTYEDAKGLFENLASEAVGYFQHFHIYLFEVYDAEDNVDIDLGAVFDGQFKWLSEERITEDPKEIDELLKEICKFLDALRRGEKWLDRNNAASLKKKIENLEDMLADAKSELDKLLDKKTNLLS